jgi:DNA-directed RNA polymerase specialized sigma24 family protein
MLDNCFEARKELLVVERQLEACNEGSYQVPHLRARKGRLMAELAAVEDYVDSLDSSLMRQLVTLHFVEGMSIKEVAAYVGYSEKHACRLLKSLPFD